MLSNKPDNMAQYITGALFDGLVDQCHGQRSGVPKKPDPTAVLQMASDLGVEPGRVLYVGDSGVDMPDRPERGHGPLRGALGVPGRSGAAGKRGRPSSLYRPGAA